MKTSTTSLNAAYSQAKSTMHRSEVGESGWSFRRFAPCGPKYERCTPPAEITAIVAEVGG